MKKLFILSISIFFSFQIVSAQNTKVNLGADISYLDPDGVSPLLYVQMQKQLKPKLFVDLEAHFMYYSELIPGFRSQAKKPLAALVKEEDYPFSSVEKTRWFNKGFKVLKTKPKKTFYFTTDFNINYLVKKSEKSEFGISSGLSFAYVDRQFTSLVLPCKYESINNEERGLVIPVMYFIRYYDFGVNVKINYTYFLSEHTGIGIRASFHKLKSSHYTSLGLYYNIRF